MNTRWPDTGATPGTALLLVVVLAGAAVAGMMTALVGSMAGARAVYYAAVFGLIVAGALVAVTRREPLRFVYFALILCFPIAGAPVPPGRFDLTVSDVTLVVLAAGMLWTRLAAPPENRAPIFPSASFLAAWLLAVPSVVFSQFPLLSLKMFVLTFATYAFFLITLEELKRPRAFERLVGLLSIVLIVMAAGCFVERFLHVNLSLRGDNLNQLSYSIAGLEIYRAGGFFQDGQKAGAWLACMIAFLLVLCVRGRLRDAKLRLLAWVAIVLGMGALLATVSRAAIAACLIISLLTLFLFNRWSVASKLAIVAGGTLALLGMALMPAETWRSLVPADVAERFRNPGEDLEIRLKIWFDTWNMFADHPLTGIGFGSFRDYLIKTQPAVFNYYGIGDWAGVIYIPDNPESGYFKILYEGGILGSLSVAVVALAALARALRVIAGNDGDTRTDVLAALAALLVFSITFLTLFTIADGRIAALVAFFLALIWHNSLRRTQPVSRGSTSR